MTSVGTPLWGLPDGWQEFKKHVVVVHLFFWLDDFFHVFGCVSLEFNGLDRYCWIALRGNDDRLIHLIDLI